MAAVVRAWMSFWLMRSIGDLHPGLLAELLGLRLEQGVGGGDEVRPLQEVQPRALGVGGRAAGGQHALEAARRPPRLAAERLQEAPAIHDV